MSPKELIAILTLTICILVSCLVTLLCMLVVLYGVAQARGIVLPRVLPLSLLIGVGVGCIVFGCSIMLLMLQG